MPEIGRNDPCPCGSGKKYKNCCLVHYRIAEQRDTHLSQAEARLLTYLYQYARQPRFNQDVLEAFNLYWGGAYDPAGANMVGPENMRRFFEWLVHDYPTRPDKQYIIDLFAASAAGRLPAEERALLEAWCQSALGVFQVVSKVAGDTLLAYDPLRQAELEIRDGVFSRAADPGEMLVGRLYQLNGTNRLAHMTMALPADFKEPLVAYLANAYQVYGSEQGQAVPWDQFLRSRGSLIQAFMLSEHARELRHLIGPGTPYADPALGREKLAAYMAARRAEKQQEAAQKQAPAAARRTSSGIILPGAPEPAAAQPEEKPKPPSILVPGRDF